MSEQSLGPCAPASGSRTTAERLDSLTGLRFFAALWVLMLHIINLLGPRIPLGYLWSYGSLGVVFFFALSGFVLTWTAGAGDPASGFWRKRVARVVPLYLVMLVVGELLLVVLPVPHGQFVVNGTGAERYVIPVLSVVMLQAWIAPHTLAFLGTSVSSPNGPGWSLSVEAFFYAMFPALIVEGARLGRRGLAWALGILVVALVAVYVAVRALNPGNQGWLAYFPVYQLGYFAAGMVIARLVRNGVRFPPLVAALVAVGVGAVVLYLGASHHVHASTDLPLVELVSLPFILVLIGAAAQADLGRRWSPFRARWLVTLGVWSYALYLVQVACFIVAACILRHGLSVHRPVACVEAVIFIVCTVAVAGLAHRIIEAPANRWVRGERQSPSAA